MPKDRWLFRLTQMNEFKSPYKPVRQWLGSLSHCLFGWSVFLHTVSNTVSEFLRSSSVETGHALNPHGLLPAGFAGVPAHAAVSGASRIPLMNISYLFLIRRPWRNF